MYNLEAKCFYRKAPPKQRIGFTRVEMGLPRLFMVLYALFGVGLLGALIRLLLRII